MTVRTFDGRVVPGSTKLAYCAACGRKSYLWPDRLCDGCQFWRDPLLRGWVERARRVADEQKFAGRMADLDV